MTKLLWLAPAFNHYKARFLNHLAQSPELELTILAGTGRQNQGDEAITGDWAFTLIREDVSKADFGQSKVIRKRLKNMIDKFDYVLIPAEKKNIWLFIYLMWLRFQSKSFQLISYNHPELKSANGKRSWLDKLLTKFYYANLDKVIFYTESSCACALNRNLIKPHKAYWANNTLDDIEIQKHYTFRLPPQEDFRFLFIGRLIPSKRIEVAIDYFEALKQKISHESLKLEIIGDGPMATLVKQAADKDVDILWHGSLVNEQHIAPIMARCHLVFVPGLSGLSINHAFAYGRPYITLEAEKHGPEINYLQPKVNGDLLSGVEAEDLAYLEKLIQDKPLMAQWCANAYQSSQSLTVQQWVNQMLKAIKDE